MFAPLPEPGDVPSDVADVVTSAVRNLASGFNITVPEQPGSLALSNLRFKARLLAECSAALKRPVPDYRLNSLETVEHVVSFYSEPWGSQIRQRERPLFHQVDMAALPSNLSIKA